jgi:parvulin-like peptidyl-prolyl isomerase
MLGEGNCMKLTCFLRFSTCAIFFVSLVTGQTPAPKTEGAKAVGAAKAAPATAAKPAVAATPATAAKPAVAATPATAAKPAVAAAPAAEADPVVLTIGNHFQVKKSEYEAFIEALPAQIQAEAKGPNKRKVAEQYAELRLLAAEARQRRIDQTPAVKVQMAFQADQFLASTLFREMQNTVKVDDAAVKAYYNEHKSEYESVKAKHILIRFQGSRVPVKEGGKDLSEAESLAKAQELKKKLDGGANFAELAKAESDDTGSGAQGGDLGEFGRGQMVPEFETAAFAQAPGKVGEPVRSAFGYHLILVESKSAKSLDEMKEQIEKQMRPELAKQEVESIKKASPITVNDTYFGQ